MKPSNIWTEVRLLLIALLIGSVFGFLTGYRVASIAIVFLAYIFWQLSQISRVRSWLARNAPIDDTPNLAGAIDGIVTAICAIKKENFSQRAKLEELLQRFNTATRAMPDAMLIVNNKQRIEWANEATKRILHIDSERDIGQRIDNIIRDPEIKQYLAQSTYSQPLEFSSKRNEQNDLLLRVIRTGDGSKLLIVHDHQDLLRLQQVRKAFISNASHEMRTPLTVIIGYLEALTLRSTPDANIQRGIEGALEQAYRLKQLIEDLLSLSRLESLPLSKSEVVKVDIAATVKDSVELVKASNVYANQRFDLKLENDINIEGDQRELKSAIQNVIDNAVKYSPPGTLIEIEWSTLFDEGPRLTIRDRGEGIEASQIPRLTERFYRVDKGRSRDMGGTGLGLSIVKHVMERHGGTLRIQSEMGVGTTVELRFPLVRLAKLSQRVSA